MKRLGLFLILWILLVGFVVGCGQPQLTVPMGVAAVTYAHVNADYAVGRFVAIQLRTAGKIDDQMWEEAKAIDLRAQTYRVEIERALANPSVPIDWEKVMQYSEQTIALLLKLGVTLAK